MTFKRIITSIIALSMAAAVQIPVCNAAGEFPEGYLYYEDFEGDTYDTIFDTPVAKSGNVEVPEKQRWSSERSFDESGNHYMKYNADVSVAAENGVNTSIFAFDRRGADNIAGGGEYPLDRDAWYEGGYKIALNGSSPYFPSSSGIGIVGTYGRCNTSLGTIRTYGGNLTMGGGVVNETIENIDGFISVKTHFNLHGSKDIENNTVQNNGEAIIYVTYRTKDGNLVEKTWNEVIPTIDHQNYKADRFRGITLNEWPNNYTGKAEIYIDDVYVKEIKTYNVIFDRNDGSGYTEEVASDLNAEVDLIEMTREGGWYLEGWYKDKEFNEPFDGKNITSDMTVYAKWLKIHTVTFNLNGGTGTETAETITDKIELPAPPTKVRYEFDGWFLDEELTIPFDGTGITGDIEVYAKWIYAWQITFITNGGDPIEPRYAVDTLTDIPEAEWLGYRFDGWFLDKELTVPFDGTGITEDIEVYAKWTKKWKITFESNGGSLVDPVYTLEDLDTLPESTKQGCGFEGWFLDKELKKPFDGTGITGDLTVYAKWNNIVYYQDFEDVNYTGEDLLAQLAPINYKSLLEEGYGVVDDGTGNRAFRAAFEINKSASISFPDAGEGLYEISYKMKPAKELIWLTGLMSPLYENKELVSGGGHSYMILGNTRILAGKVSLAVGYIEMTYWIDTINNTSSIIGKYTDRYGQTYTESVYNTAVTNDMKGLDGLVIFRPDYRIESTKTDYYIDEICVKKIESPKVESITPSDGEKDVSLNPEIKIEFSEAMDRSTLTSDNIYIEDSDGNKPSQKVEISTQDGRSVVKLILDNSLEYEKEYTIRASMSITNGTYFLDHDYESKFTTRPQKFQVNSSLKYTDTGMDVSTMSYAAGKNITASLTLRNYAGKETESYFVSAVLEDTTTGRQIGYSHSIGELAMGEEKEVLRASFDVPETVTDSYKVKFYIWDSTKDRNSMWETIIKP